jgi:AcrR family transcriptional regulator
MAYRATPRTEARRVATRTAILDAVVRLLAAGGWGAATVAAVADEAGVATGTVYRHWAGKDDLLAEAFRLAAGRELGQVSAAAAAAEPAAARIAGCLRVFAQRALRGHRLAYALLAEPANPAVEAERLAYRRAYRDVFRELLDEGQRTGEFAAHDAEVHAAVIVGAAGEALVGPVAPARHAPKAEPTVDELVTACVRALPAPAPVVSRLDHKHVVHP